MPTNGICLINFLIIDSFWGNTDVCIPYSILMGPIWPFRKKKPDRPSISRKSYMKNVVEYERKTKKEEKEKEEHLNDKKFIDALKLLSKK
tara:strand:+ start:168 stop:437 length:270 start_codon:yes stop_codon:yes gene_type:complete